MYGRTTGWSGRIDRPPSESGQSPSEHRLRSEDDRGVHPRAGSTASGDPEPEGLRKFDLGTVPASVTPPRTWRRAAWFAIASSGAVLGSLALVTMLIEDQPRDENLDLPGVPRGEHLAMLTPSSSSLPDPFEAIELVPKAATTTTEPTEQPGHSTTPAPPPGTDRPGESALPPSPSTTRTEPPPTSEAFELVTLADPDVVARRSDEYFSHVRAGDLRSAYALTTGALREEGYERFAARYADIESMEITEVHTSSSKTVTTLRIERPDGSTETQRRELRFTSGEDPLVRSDQQVD
ncbi:hypothetical protein [Parasphingorhabdus pacifica]